MDIRALRYFVEVVGTNSFTRAAENLYVTQPTISKMVKSLEDELGGPLLLREGRQVRLTDAGRVVYARGQQLLQDAERLRQEVAEVDGIARGALTVGISPTTGHYMAPIIAQYQKSYPGVQLQLREQGARALEQAVSSGEIDLAMGLLRPGSTLASLPIKTHTTVAVFAKSRAPQCANQVRWCDLATLPFVMYESDFALHEGVRACCERAGFTPQIALQSRYWDFIGDLVAADVGVAIMFEHVAARYDPNLVTCLPLVQPTLSHDFGLTWRTDYLPRAGKAWVELCRALYAPAAS
ncbi:MAG: LysR substrate-binding domain-containing protein [Comamonas sp.]